MSSSIRTSAAASAASAFARSPDSQCQMWLVCLSGGAVRAEDEGVLLERLVRIDDDRQRLVVDEDRGDAVGGGVAARRDDRRDLLALVHDGVGRQHHLHVAGEGRHPVELVALQVLAGDDRGDARDLQRLRAVDRLDLRVGVRAADDVEPEHARQDEVVDVLAGAADEPRILLALDRVAHAPDFGGGLERLVVISSLPAQLAGAASMVSAASTGRRLARLELAGRLLDRLDDVHVAGAAAEVAADPLADLVLARFRRSGRAARRPA